MRMMLQLASVPFAVLGVFNENGLALGFGVYLLVAAQQIR